MTDKDDLVANGGWDRGWEQHRTRQLIRMSKLSMAQKLQWLEDMQRLFENLKRQSSHVTDDQSGKN